MGLSLLQNDGAATDEVGEHEAGEEISVDLQDERTEAEAVLEEAI